MRRTNGIGAAFVALLAVGTAANADAQTKFEPLKFRVVTDKKTYAANTPIKMTFTVKNTSAKPIALTFTSGQRYDITILQGKKTLWQWSKGRMFTMDIGTETLGAGKILVYTETYKPGTVGMPALKPGIYMASAFPYTMNMVSLHTTTTFKVVAAK